jgi:phosphomannomutase
LLIRSISGLRGTVGIDASGLSCEVVSRYASLFASYLGNQGVIALGYDGRKGGDLFYKCAAEAIRSAGCDVMMLGVVPTPTVQMAAEHGEGVVGGIAITASHNPSQWNGMKFIAGTGLFLDADENHALWDLVDGVGSRTVPIESFGNLLDGSASIEQHLELVLTIPFLALERIRARKFRVVVDAVNASGSIIIPRLLRALGVEEIIELACDASGIFPHKPEPVPGHLTGLSEAVIKHKADFGIAVDPDADRLVLIMENGEPFIEENTIVLAVEQVLKHLDEGQRVVVNLSTTRAVEDVAALFGSEVIRTPVGEINVSKRMKSIGAVIGGEGSGGVILPSVHYGRDSLVGVALALSALAEFPGTISEKKRAMPQYTIRKSKIDSESQDQIRIILEKLEASLAGKSTSVNREDGLRFEFAHSWLHARSSNTEPIIRLIAEAPTAAEADTLLEFAQASIA